MHLRARTRTPVTIRKLQLTVAFRGRRDHPHRDQPQVHRAPKSRRRCVSPASNSSTGTHRRTATSPWRCRAPRDTSAAAQRSPLPRAPMVHHGCGVAVGGCLTDGLDACAARNDKTRKPIRPAIVNGLPQLPNFSRVTAAVALAGSLPVAAHRAAYASGREEARIDVACRARGPRQHSESANRESHRIARHGVGVGQALRENAHLPVGDLVRWKAWPSRGARSSAAAVGTPRPGGLVRRHQSDLRPPPLARDCRATSALRERRTR